MPDSVRLRDAEELDPVAEFVGRLDVGRRDRRDALDIDRVRVDLGAEGNRRQQRQLVGGVVAVDVEGRVGLGVAQPLGCGEALGERQALVLHAGQDVVAGAVEDAVDAADRVAGEGLAQRLDDRDAAGRRGLEIEADARLSPPGGRARRRARREAPCWR